MHESRRKSNSKYMTDVYDSPRWRRIAGDPGTTLTRIILQLCVDGFPWSSRKHHGSVKP